MTTDTLIINDRECHFLRHGTGGPALILISHDNLDDVKSLTDLVVKRTSEKQFSLFNYKVHSWDNELSPWQSGTFTGHAEETLNNIKNYVIPFLNEQGYTDMKIAGYSLAGLFALWCVRRSGIFSAAASCSGSLWYPSWSEFSEQYPVIRPESIIYLSLGGKEALSKDPLISTILTKTKEESERLKKDKNVKRTTLEMNAGGHFTKIQERLAKGIAYLLEN